MFIISEIASGMALPCGARYIGIGNTEQLPTSINRDTVKCYTNNKVSRGQVEKSEVRVYRINSRREQTMELTVV